MGIAEMTVKRKPAKFCKFSVTFWVDNENAVPSSFSRFRNQVRRVIFPLKSD